MLKKQSYTAPEAEILVLRFEEDFLQGTSVLGIPGQDDEIENLGQF